jgi:hypothetical protein
MVSTNKVQQKNLQSFRLVSPSLTIVSCFPAPTHAILHPVILPRFNLPLVNFVTGHVK